MDVVTLAELLRETAEHHDPFEKTAPKHDWWDWYAPYLDARQHGSTPEQASNAADLYMEQVRHISREVGLRAASGAAANNQPSDANRMRRILVATDGSSSSAAAIALAVELASEHTHNSELTFVHVVPTVDLLPAIGFEGAGAAIPHQPTEYDHTLLESAAALAAAHGVVATTALVGGSTAQEIVAYAESRRSDLIVIGSSGHGAVASALLGSVSLAVLRESKRPVVIVHGATTTPAPADAVQARAS